MHRPSSGGARLLLRAMMLAGLAGLCLAILGSLLRGQSAAYGALIGTAVTALVLFGGSLVVDVVASLLPAASMLVALLTYTLQLILLGVAFIAVQRSAEAQELLDQGWIGFAVIAVTVTWMIAQIVLTARTRIPAFEAFEGDHP